MFAQEPGAGEQVPVGSIVGLRTEQAPSSSSARLLAACTAGARAYDGIAIATFKDPTSAGQVICWADGHVAKSPAPSPDHAKPREFDRLVFKATLDGRNIVLVEAGYRNTLPVKAPTG